MTTPWSFPAQRRFLQERLPAFQSLWLSKTSGKSDLQECLNAIFDEWARRYITPDANRSHMDAKQREGIYAWLVERVRINSSRIRQERERKVRDAENRRMVEILKQFPSHEVEMHIHEEEGKTVYSWTRVVEFDVQEADGEDQVESEMPELLEID